MLILNSYLSVLVRSQREYLDMNVVTWHTSVTCKRVQWHKGEIAFFVEK